MATGSSGRRYRVTEHVEMINTDPLLDPDRWEEGERFLQLANGTRVLELQPNVYAIASTGERLRPDR